MIRPDAKIHVVLYPYGPHVDVDDDERYKNFFGTRIKQKNIMRITIQDYIKKLTGK